MIDRRIVIRFDTPSSEVEATTMALAPLKRHRTGTPRVLTHVACVAVYLSFALARTARACPVCDSETGQQVRAELRDEHLGVSVLATVVPFVLVLGVVAAVHFGPPRIRRRP